MTLSILIAEVTTVDKAFGAGETMYHVLPAVAIVFGVANGIVIPPDVGIL